MRLILVRHGETEDNAAGLIQGHSQGRLSSKGREQCRKLALRLKDEKIDIIFSSDLLRAKETASEIAKFHNVPIVYTEELREQKLGVFEGGDKAVFKKAVERSGLGRVNFMPEGGESYRDVWNRAKIFFDRLMKDFNGKTVLVSSHRGFNRMLLGIVLGKPIDYAAKIEQDNACVSIIDVSKSSKVIRINSTEHL